jgi:myosin-6
VEKLHSDLIDRMNQQMKVIKTKVEEQRNAEEQERLRQIQLALEAERKAKEEERQRQLQEEETRRLKAEMERIRKQEEAEKAFQEEQDRKSAMMLQAQLEKEAMEDMKYRQQLEQERRDHELALRLAQESNGQVDDGELYRTTSDASLSNPNRLIRSEAIRAQQEANGKQKYDLSKWKYSELRDAINTSCDLELLDACRHEFHRRLKVYHAWKAKNRKRTTLEENERAPKSIMEAAAKASLRAHPVKSDVSSSTHRYFRIPFVRSNASPNECRGLWYAHFSGNYVARQMELHADKPPILLVAGVDDMQMCELSLEETGLTRKRGAEILEHEFNREWERNGGKPWRSLV